MAFKSIMLSIVAAALFGAPVAAQVGADLPVSAGKVVNRLRFSERWSIDLPVRHKAEGGVLTFALIAFAAAGFGLYQVVDGNKLSGA